MWIGIQSSSGSIVWFWLCSLLIGLICIYGPLIRGQGSLACTKTILHRTPSVKCPLKSYCSLEGFRSWTLKTQGRPNLMGQKVQLHSVQGWKQADLRWHEENALWRTILHIYNKENYFSRCVYLSRAGQVGPDDL